MFTVKSMHFRNPINGFDGDGFRYISGTWKKETYEEALEAANVCYENNVKSLGMPLSEVMDKKEYIFIGIAIYNDKDELIYQKYLTYED